MGKRRILVKWLPAKCPTRGKIICDTRKDARIAAARIRNRTGHLNVHAYPCPDAKHWHVGHDNFFKGERPNRRNSALAAIGNARLYGQVSRPAVSGSGPTGESEVSPMGNVIAGLRTADTGTEECL